MTRSLLLLSITLLLASPAAAEEWRYYAGGTATRWTARGIHGHTEDCRTRACDSADWDRGNLDSAIGYRFGATRPLREVGRFQATGGLDLAVITTEYNLSQRDFWVVIPSANLGLEGQVGLFAYGVSAGVGGAFTDDGRSRTAPSAEGHLDFNANDHAGMRFGFRRSYVGSARLREIAILVHASGLGEHERSPWNYEFLFGATEPGGAFGKNLSLSRAPVQKNALYRERGGGTGRVGLTWTGSAHESRLRSEFYGVSGNQRGKMIPSVGLVWDRKVALRRVTVRVGGGAEIADWSDDHELLVDDSLVVEQGLDAALVGTVGADFRVVPGVRLILGVDHLHWAASGLGERRVFAGVGVRL